MAKQAPARQPPPIVVIYGDEQYQKADALRAALDRLLPPDVDRGMALAEYDGTRGEEQGGPTLAAVMDDLATLPFLADRRVVVVTDADRFITAARQKLEHYLDKPHASATLVLTCKSFPRNTKLHKKAADVGAWIKECHPLREPALAEFVVARAADQGKRLNPAVAGRLVNLVGAEQGVLASEVDKLALYVGQRSEITAEDVAALIGLSREERIFAVMDAAAAGRLPDALDLWRQVLLSDPAAEFKAAAGIAYVLRNWLRAHRLHHQGAKPAQIAPKVRMYRRERELAALLHRLPMHRVEALLAQLAFLDAQAKTGLRSISTGVERLLVSIAAPAA